MVALTDIPKSVAASKVLADLRNFACKKLTLTRPPLDGLSRYVLGE